MTSVWILLVISSGAYMGNSISGITLIDNIANRAECERVSKIISDGRYIYSTRCIEVFKRAI